MYTLAKHKLVNSVQNCAIWEFKPDVADICEEDSVYLLNKNRV